MTYPVGPPPFHTRAHTHTDPSPPPPSPYVYSPPPSVSPYFSPSGGGGSNPSAYTSPAPVTYASPSPYVPTYSSPSKSNASGEPACLPAYLAGTLASATRACAHACTASPAACCVHASAACCARPSLHVACPPALPSLGQSGGEQALLGSLAVPAAVCSLPAACIQLWRAIWESWHCVEAPPLPQQV